MNARATSLASADVIRGVGDAADRLRALDWERHPLGPPAGWPQSLRTALELCLSARYPICIFWGPQYSYFYNDAYAPILGGKHPAALAQPYPEVWPEIWETAIRPILREVEHTGVASWSENLLLVLQRHGFDEECYFGFSFAPIRDEAGGIGGFFVPCTETTTQVTGDRRMRTLRELSARGTEARSPEAACKIATTVFAENPRDVPFALLYLTSANGTETALAASVGVDQHRSLCPENISLNAKRHDEIWPLADAAREKGPIICRHLTGRLGALPGWPWPKPCHTAMILPLLRAGDAGPYGFLVAGVSPARPLDSDYQTFFTLAASQVATLISNGIAYVEERRRADELAQIDRAKTVFFSNVSHELRTPLTLLLGPLEEIIAQPSGASGGKDRELATVAHRNGLRLLKLVNTLLDFSRIESGRVEARYEPVDLAALTIDLTSAFRSAIEKAGLKFTVDCPRLSAPVYVDRDMWEKIVLNLLSNALKFTFAGEISVMLRGTGDFARLTVQDTGTGIPVTVKERVFERFYRVPDAKGRTLEGTGIGLALVRELARLHGGDAKVESTVGRGSAFTVSVRRGRGHLLPEHITEPSAVRDNSASAAPFIDEAAQWLATESFAPTTGSRGGSGNPPLPVAAQRWAKVLVVDDNADMRNYIARLLTPEFEVITAANGEAALELIEREAPQLVLSDVMMPQRDGYGLLEAIRARPEWQALPVILLSARAGEESCVEGAESGADDYLIKPFGARELIARVKMHVRLARRREQATHTLAESERRFQLAVMAGEVGSWDWDIPADRVTWSDQTYRIFGVKPGAHDGRLETVKKFIHPDDRARVGRAIEQSLKELGNYKVDLRIVRGDGEVRWVAVNGQVIPDEQKRAVRMLGAIIDVTEREQAAAALRESERHFRELVKNVPVAIYTCDAAGRITLYNEAAASLWGRAPVVGKESWCGSFRIFTPNGSPVALDTCPMALALKEGRAVRGVEILIERPDGLRRRVLPYPSPLRDDSGAVTGAVNVLIDITDHRDTASDSRRLAAIVESSADAIISKDLNGMIASWNRGAERLFGYTAEEAIGRPITMLIPEGRANEEPEIIRRIRQGERVEHYETVRQHKDGRMLQVSLTVSPVKDGDGRVIGASKIARDIGERKRAEQHAEFLTQFNRRLEPIADPGALSEVAQAALGEYLGAERCYLFELDAKGENATVPADWRKEGLPGIAGVYDVKDYSAPELLRLLAEPRCAIKDIKTDPITRKKWPRYEALKMRSFAAASFHREGRWMGSLVVANGQPRQWRDDELILLENAVARVWPLIERARSSRALSTSETFLQSVLSSSRDCLKVLDFEGRFLWMSDKGIELFGVRNFELLKNQSWTDLWKDAVTRDEAAAAVAGAKAGRSSRFWGFCPTSNGEPKWWDVMVSPILGPKGQPERILAVSRDITEARRAEAALRESEERLRQGVLAANMGSWRVDLATGLRTRDANHNRILGQPAVETTGPFDEGPELIHPEDRAATMAAWKKAIESAGMYEAEFRIVRPDGTYRWLREQGRLIAGERGAAGYVTGVSLDITTRKIAELELQRARDHALAASRAKDDFLAALSHELRTPLHPVLLLASDGAQNPDWPAEVRADFEAIRKNVDLEARLIDDLLDLTRITRGKLALELRSLDLHAILADAIATVQPDIDEKEIRLITRLDAAESHVRGDAVRLQQIFWNVLKNAVKFTPSGGSITVKTSVRAESGQVVLTVADTGIGLTPKEIGGLFTAFAQGEHAGPGGSHRFGGLGLGLAISRMLAELHGGRISAASAGRNEGAEFTMEFPLEQSAGRNRLATAPAASTETPRSNDGAQAENSAEAGRILLVDDHATTRHTLAHLLMRRRYHVAAAGSVAEAQALAGRENFDLVISDIGLPDGDGCALMTGLRVSNPELKGIALSGYGMVEDVLRSREAGFAEHLTKPINIGKLERAVAGLLRASAPASMSDG